MLLKIAPGPLRRQECRRGTQGPRGHPVRQGSGDLVGDWTMFDSASRRSCLRAGLCLSGVALPVLADDLDPNPSQVNFTQLRNAVRLGCSWLTDVAQVKADRLNGEN